MIYRFMAGQIKHKNDWHSLTEVSVDWKPQNKLDLDSHKKK